MFASVSAFTEDAAAFVLLHRHNNILHFPRKKSNHHQRRPCSPPAPGQRRPPQLRHPILLRLPNQLDLPMISSVGNVSDWQVYPSIYVAAVVNPLGPNDKGTAKCLFLLDFASRKVVSKKNKKKRFVVVGVSIGLIVTVFIVIGGLWFWRRKYGMMKRKRRKLNRLDHHREHDSGEVQIRRDQEGNQEFLQG
ncbi:Probable LRR receptor-like serine/threonine-protein kinase RKF3 [Linum grandiflorum]